METIRVNMTPCEDVQTIHASQNDNEAREWGFELHNNGEKIDSSSISDQLVFKAYEGGTEELLPSSLMNGSVDLGSLAWTYMPNNYFRSTSVISDAKIPSNENTVANIFCSILKPNTANNVYANNEGIAIDGTGRIRIYYDDMPTDAVSFAQAMQGVLLWYEKNDSTPTTTPFLGDIKYPQGLLTNQQFTYRESPTEEDGLANIVDIKGQTLKWNQLQPNNISRTNNGITYTYDNGKLTVTGTATSTSWWLYGGLPTMSMKANHKYLFVFGKGMADSSLTTYNWYLPNSGQRFYADGIITINSDTDQYIQLQVMQGYTIDAVFYPQVFDLTLIFSSGNEPTSVEEFRNLFPLSYYSYNSGSLIPFNGNGIKTVGKNQIANVVRGYFSVGASAISVDNDSESFVFYAIKGKTYVSSSVVTLNRNAIARCDSPNLVNGSPIYDVVNTSRTWTATWTGWAVWYAYSSKNEEVENSAQVEFGTTATAYEPYTSSTLSLPISTYFTNGMKSAGNVYDELTETKAITRVGSRAYQSGDEDDTSVITDGTTTYYALATPTETPFTTASLVTENAEIPLSNEDGVLIGKCTDQLSAEPGFHDAKIKLADTDGECYSNKIQLHIERSPQ